MKHFISILFLSGFAVFGSVAEAQNNPSNPNRLSVNPTVEIITDYQGKIAEANRIGAPFSADSLTAARPNFSYQSLPPMLNNRFTMQPIPAARMNIPTNLKDDKLRYFRGSLSFPLTPDLNFYMNTYFRGNTYFNLYLNHHSFWGKTPLYKDAPTTINPLPSEIRADNANTRIGAALTHFWDNTAVDIHVAYNNRYHTYYGHDTLFLKSGATAGYIDKIFSNKYMKEDMSQTFHILQTDISLYSVSRAGNRTNFKIDGSFNYIKETAHLKTSQSLLGVKARLNHLINDPHAIDVELGAKAYNRLGNGSLSDAVLYLAPCYQYRDNGFSITAGLNLEGVNSNSNFSVNVYPKIALSYSVTEWFIPYASATGGTQLNNYEKIITENPYILSGTAVANSRHLINFQGGIRGNVNPFMAYQLNVGYSVIDSMYFFVNSDNSRLIMPGPPQLLCSNFQAVHDNVKLLTFGGSLSSKFGSAFEALLRAQYYQYTLTDIDEAWHRPEFELGLNLRYRTEKFIFNVNGYFRGETPVQLNSEYDRLTTRTPGYFNLGLMAEYRISPQISAFAQVSNLLNNNYQQYYLYYNPGITFGGGFSVAF